MQQFDWKHVAIITQEEDLFTLIIISALLHYVHHYIAYILCTIIADIHRCNLIANSAFKSNIYVHT